MARPLIFLGGIKARIRSMTRPFFLASSLVLLSLSVLFMADLFGLETSSNDNSKETRKVIAETLAVQLSTLASKGEVSDIQAAISRFVLRNDDVHAAAMIRDTGVVVAQIGDMSQFDESVSRSTSTQLRVPIYQGSESWGEVHVVFEAAASRWREVIAFAFIAFFSLVSFTAFLGRALVQLDPGKAVPGRVDSAMDLFNAGVIVLDGNLRIVMANKSAEAMAENDSKELIGDTLESWAWKRDAGWEALWKSTLETGVSVSDHHMTLQTRSGDERSVLVSCVFVGDSDSEAKGVLVTLDDVTTLENQNRNLTTMVERLRDYQNVIEEKNRDLKKLATTDGLTGIANRRSLMESLEELYSEAISHEAPLSCIMTDIDFFKQVNDTYGHKVGDDVIVACADVLKSLAREQDVVGRYGGEEFVMVLPGLNAAAAAEIAERARVATLALAYGDDLPLESLSSSYGVADLTSGVTNSPSLVDTADSCLYLAKEQGRNRVVVFDSKGMEAADSLVPVVQSPAVAVVPRSTSDHYQARMLELQKMIEQRDDQLNRMDEYDANTGIPLRKVFLQRAEAELMNSGRSDALVGIISFCFRDIDRLISKFGYVLCQELLNEVIERLQNGLRSTDLVSMLSDEHSLSRLTLNEYAVLLSSLSDTTSAMIVVTRLKRMLSKPFFVSGEKVYMGASIGIAVSESSGQDADSLLNEANEARTTAHSMPEKTSHVFSQRRLQEASIDYIQLESDLYDALDNDDIETWFQPKYDLSTERVVGMEALLRWKHHKRGFVSPEVFVAVAEANGLIDRLTHKVLNAALQQIVVWRAMGFDELKVSVNMSPMQLRAHTLVDETLQQLRSAGVDGCQLEIELTETSVLENLEQARQDLARLRDAGVGISIDDFGTGYTSLSLLAELPLDVVKIDKSFISAIDTGVRPRAVVGSVIGMAHALGLRVVAEGVECMSQMELLRQLGCDEVQGYFVSRPLPAEEITAFLVNQRFGELKKSA